MKNHPLLKSPVLANYPSSPFTLWSFKIAKKKFLSISRATELLSTQKTRSVCSESTTRQQKYSPHRGETGEGRRASGASSTRRRVPGGPRPAGASDEARRLESGGRSGSPAGSSAADARDVDMRCTYPEGIFPVPLSGPTCQ